MMSQPKIDLEQGYLLYISFLYFKNRPPYEVGSALICVLQLVLDELCFLMLDKKIAAKEIQTLYKKVPKVSSQGEEWPYFGAWDPVFKKKFQEKLFDRQNATVYKVNQDGLQIGEWIDQQNMRDDRFENEVKQILTPNVCGEIKTIIDEMEEIDDEIELIERVRENLKYIIPGECGA